MKKIAVVYWSGTGNTEAMANAIAEGVKAAGGEVDVLTAGNFNAGAVAGYDAIAFGCPAMGSEELGRWSVAAGLGRTLRERRRCCCGYERSARHGGT